jgi:hypothetical protein
MQKHIKIIPLLLCFTLLIPFSAFAIDVQLSGIKVTDTTKDLLLSLKVEARLMKNWKRLY